MLRLQPVTQGDQIRAIKVHEERYFMRGTENNLQGDAQQHDPRSSREWEPEKSPGQS